MFEPGTDRWVDRRSLIINWLLGTSLAAFVGSVLYPVARFLNPPRVVESTASSVTLDVTPASVKPNSGEVFKLGSRPAILVRTPAGELKAYSAICTHLGCTVQYRADLQHIWCACHNGHFDPSTGRNIGGPPPRPLEAYVAAPRGDKVVVSRA